MSLPATACQASLTPVEVFGDEHGVHAGQRQGRRVSMPLIVARANGLRTKHACNMPGRVTSSTKVPCR